MGFYLCIEKCLSKKFEEEPACAWHTAASRHTGRTRRGLSTPAPALSWRMPAQDNGKTHAMKHSFCNNETVGNNLAFALRVVREVRARRQETAFVKDNECGAQRWRKLTREQQGLSAASTPGTQAMKIGSDVRTHTHSKKLWEEEGCCGNVAGQRLHLSQWYYGRPWWLLLLARRTSRLITQEPDGVLTSLVAQFQQLRFPSVSIKSRKTRWNKTFPNSQSK